MKKHFILLEILLAILIYACQNPVLHTKTICTEDNSSSYTNHHTITPDAFQKFTQIQSEQAILRSQVNEKIPTNATIPPFQKPAQYFYISPDKDTTIICKEGTQLTFIANSFIVQATEHIPSDNIKITITEFYQISDMVLANLTTKSHDDIIETGGMLHITATSNNKTCILQKGKTIQIGFPYTQQQDHMQLFTGHWIHNHINWTPVDSMITKQSLIPPSLTIKKTTTPTSKCSKEIESTPAQKITYPYSAIAQKLEGTVIVEFLIDEYGNATNISIPRAVHPILDKAAYYIVSTRPKWNLEKPTTTPIRCRVPILFQLNDIHMDGATINLAKQFEEKIMDITVVYGTLNSAILDTNIQVQFEKKTNDQNLHQTHLESIHQYLFSTNQLGWINCDRFFYDPRPKIQYIVQTNKNEETQIKAVFHSFKSIVGGYPDGDKCIFKNVPLGEKVTIVALKKVNNQILLAIQETTFKPTFAVDLHYTPITMARLEKELEKLNNLY